MNIWHITPYDTIPGEGWRPGRAISMCKLFAEHGHQVTWWTSSFSHFFKRFRSKGWADIEVSPNLRIKLVPAPGYQKHFGLARLRFHLVYAWRLYRRALQEPPPDTIILALPTPGAEYVAVKLAKHFGARLIVDIRDLWPEWFVLAFPLALRRFAPIVLSPLYALRSYAFRNADAVTAVTKGCLDVALKDVPYLKNGRSQVIYFGADVADLREMMDQVDSADTRIRKLPWEVWAIYAGTLGYGYDIETVLDAAILLNERVPDFKIVMAGNGPKRDYVTEFIQHHGLNNVLYLGPLPLSELAKYYRVSDIGLSPYRNHEYSTVMMTAKIYDYLSAGLPVVNSLHGELEEFLLENGIGVQYTSGDAESLATVLIELGGDEKRRLTMARNSYNAAMRFDRQTQYLKFLELLQQVVSQ